MVLNGLSGAQALVCTLAVWAVGLFICYWVIRLAVRHALTDVGVRRLVARADEDAEEDEPPAAPDDGQS